jgi:hypothetical protein
VVCGVFAAAQALLVSASVSVPTAKSCSELRAWARPFAGTSPSLDDIAGFDRPHRLAVFNAVSPTIRASLWQDQLRRFDRWSDLSAPQHALIGEAIALTTPAVYEQEPAATAAMRQFHAQAMPAFTSIPHRRAWTDLGSVVTGAQPPQQPPSAWARLAGAFSVSAAGTANCDCAAGHGDCARCVTGGCSGAPTGCGPGGGYPCNGVCK